MAKRGWTQYCKDSSGDFAFLKNLIKNGSKVNLKVFYGGEALVPEALLCGAAGVIAITANYEPQTFVQTYNAAINHNVDELLELDKRILLLRESLFMAGSCWVSGTKYAVAARNQGNGKPVCPLQPLSQEQKKLIDQLINL
jgi:dihydrodipicolinate synthase/N-acetylneuraminate lyase